MAYVYDDKELDEDLERKDSGMSLGAESGVMTAEQTGQQDNANGTGQYTNLQSYLNQNKQRDFGGEFTDKVGDSVVGAQNKQSEVANQFKSDADSGSTKLDENLLNEATNSPETVVNNEQNLSSFRTMQKGEYKGPEQFSGNDQYYTPAKTAVDDAVEYTKQAQTSSGQKALLDTFYGSGAKNYGYTQGQQNLDQILLGMNPDTRGKLQTQEQKAKEAQMGFGNLETELNNYASTKKGESAATGKAVNDALGAATTGYENQIKDRVGSVLSKRDQDIQRINQAINSRNASQLSQDDLKLLGISTASPLYKFNGNAVLQNNDQNLNSLTTPEEYAKLNAYLNLSNKENTLLTDPSQIGQGIDKPLYSTNQDFGNTLKANETAYQQALQDTYYIPNDTTHWYTKGGSARNGQQVGYNILDPDLIKRLEADAAYYGIQPENFSMIQDVLNKKKAIASQYGANDYFNGFAPNGDTLAIGKKYRT